MDSDQTTHQQMRQELLDKAAADDGFRARLTADPKAAIKEALAVDLPESVAVHVHEESALSAHLVLPPSAELTAADLEVVAGGHKRTSTYSDDVPHLHDDDGRPIGRE